MTAYSLKAEHESRQAVGKGKKAVYTEAIQVLENQKAEFFSITESTSALLTTLSIYKVSVKDFPQ
jgi:hypothetical protein